MCVDAQIFVRSSGFLSFNQFSCIRQTFVRSCPVFFAFIFMPMLFYVHQISCVHPIFVRSCQNFCAFLRFFFDQPIFLHSTEFRALMSRFWCVHAQIFVRSTDFRAFNRLLWVRLEILSRFSCIHQIFVRYPNFGALMPRFLCVLQTFVRSCPDFFAFDSNSGPNFCAFTRCLCVDAISVHAQTFVRSTDFRFFNRLLCIRLEYISEFGAFTKFLCVHVRIWCVHQNFVRSPDFHAFTPRLLCVHQIFVRSTDLRLFMPIFCAFNRFSFVHPIFLRSPDYRAFMSRRWCVHGQTFVRATYFRAFNRLSCIHVQTFVRSPDLLAFIQFSCVQQTFMVRLSRVHQSLRAFMIKFSCVFPCFQTT